MNLIVRSVIITVVLVMVPSTRAVSANLSDTQAVSAEITDSSHEQMVVNPANCDCGCVYEQECDGEVCVKRVGNECKEWKPNCQTVCARCKQCPREGGR